MNYLSYIGGTAYAVPFPQEMVFFFVLAVIWSSIWKGIALWKSGRNKQLAWFIVLLVVNTLGLLEIIYLAFFQKGKKTAVARKKK